MDDGRSCYLVLGILFLAFSFLFSLAASAMIGVSDAEMKEKAEDGDPRAKRLMKVMGFPDIADRIRTASFACAAFACACLYGLFAGLWLPLAGGRGVIFALIALGCAFLSVWISVGIGVKLPHLVGSFYAGAIGYGAARLFPWLLWPFLPLTFPVRLISRLLARLFGADPKKTAERVTEEEIRMLVDAGKEMGVIEESQKEMINNIFEFDDTTVGDVMTHRTNLVAAEKDASVREVVKLAVDEGFSRIPVYEKDLDDIIGFVHVKDLLVLIGEDPDQTGITPFIRPAVYLPEHLKCRSAFGEFKKSQTSIAVVVDEYGGTEGIVTMEDLLESIVGEIADEYDEEERSIIQVDPDTYLIEGTEELSDLSDFLKIPFEDDEDFDTLGGFMIHMLGRIPKAGENPSVEYCGYRFTAALVQERRVAKVRVSRLPVPKEKAGEEE